MEKIQTRFSAGRLILNDMNYSVGQWGERTIELSQTYAEAVTRAALFIIFFWFGLLKIVDVSPATGLVEALLAQLMPWMSINIFLPAFGFFEAFIGLLFLVPRLSWLAVILFVFHISSAFFPLLLLPEFVWQGIFTPTLEGQYIIKNVALIALVVCLVTQLKTQALLEPTPPKEV